MAQLELYKDKCVNLEIQMKADEARLKNSSDTKEIDTLRDCLKVCCHTTVNWYDPNIFAIS